MIPSPRLCRAMLLIIAAVLLCVQAPRWSAAFKVSATGVTLALASGPVRIRTVLVFESGQALRLALGAGQ